MGGIIDDEMVASVEGTGGEAKVERGFGCITISHEEASSAFGRELFFVILYNIANGAKDVKIAKVRTLFMD